MKSELTVAICVCALLGSGARSEAGSITVNAGGSVQAAIDAARPGDTIFLQAGATFTGNFKLPAKGGTTYITIRSSASDSALAAAGPRMSPAYASLLPKVRSTQNGPAFRTISGASYWRLMFLEILPSTSVNAVNLIELGAGGSTQTSLADVPHHLIVDRCYIHGDPGYGMRRGIALNSGETQIINSHFSDIKGINQDTQAIAGWNGPGPYLIQNNHIEAAAENILFGGSDPGIANLVPSNITIRRNTLSKPLAWRTQSWVVKNLLEFKNAQHVLVDGNIIENNWAAGQQGYAILFTPRNQSGGAPWSVVRDVTVQNNVIRDVAAVFNVSGHDDIYPSQQTTDITVRNNLIYDVSTGYGTSANPSPGRLAIIGNGPKNVVFDHNTVDNDGTGTIMFYGGLSPSVVSGFELTNNLLRDNAYGLVGDSVAEGSATLVKFAPNAIVLRNTFAGGSAKTYPTGNDFPALAQWIADFANRAAADYRLDSSSLSNNAGTDGTDIGVDFAELNAAMNASAPPPPPPPPPPPSGGTLAPYAGAPVSLPGKIEAENYDKGGEGVASHDTTAGNSGGVYRSDNVDLQTCTDGGSGYKLKTTVAGEWLKYSVNVTSAGTYTIDVRVSSSGGGGTFHIEINGVDKTGPMAIPNTGGWEAWRTISKSGVTIGAGQQIVRLVMDVNGATGLVGNFNWIQVR